VRIYNPNGTLMKGSKSPEGFTYSYVINNVKNMEYYKPFQASGWGNDNGKLYFPGEYIYEIWNNGEKIASRNVFVYDSENTDFENYHIKK
jgi:hypothetical protein